MAKPATTNRSNARVSQLRKGATLKMVRLSCPDAAQALKIAESFSTTVVDSDSIRSLHERLIVETADSLSEGLGERAMQIHLQQSSEPSSDRRTAPGNSTPAPSQRRATRPPRH